MDEDREFGYRYWMMRQNLQAKTELAAGCVKSYFDYVNTYLNEIMERVKGKAPYKFTIWEGLPPSVVHGIIHSNITEYDTLKELLGYSIGVQDFAQSSENAAMLEAAKRAAGQLEQAVQGRDNKPLSGV